jgi:hypothetical protein
MVASGDKILEQMERELPAVLNTNLPDGIVYHYTDAFGLEGIVRKKQIWATHYRFQNDPRELKEGEDFVRELAKAMLVESGTPLERHLLLKSFLDDYEQMAVTKIVKDLYIASFTEARDDLSQWRAYGGRGGGYCIGVKMRLVDDTPAAKDLNQTLGVTGPLGASPYASRTRPSRASVSGASSHSPRLRPDPKRTRCAPPRRGWSRTSRFRWS